MAELESQVRKVLAAVLSIEIDVIDRSSDRNTLPRWDSLRHMNLVLALEQEFGVEIADEEIPLLFSVEGILRLLEEKMS